MVFRKNFLLSRNWKESCDIFFESKEVFYLNKTIEKSLGFGEK